MTALTQAVAIGDNQIYIDAALAAGQVPGYVKIDDELLNVGGQDNLAGTTLVLASPAQEAHDSGATVTYAGRPYDPTFKTALSGGEQTIRMFYHSIAFNSPDITTTGFDLWTPTTEQVILDVWLRVRTAWNSDVAEVMLKSRNNDDQLYASDGAGLWWDLKLAESPAGDYGRILSANNNKTHVGSASAMVAANATASSGYGRLTRAFPAHVLVSTPIFAEVYVEGVASAGAAEFWFLTAEPAA